MVSFLKKLVFLFLLPFTLSAQNWHFEIDNDLVFSADEAYTGGFSITYVGDELSKAEDGIYRDYTVAMRNLFETLTFGDFSDKKINASLSLQQVTITPSDIETKTPLYLENPYAGVLVGHFSLFVWDYESFDQFRLSAGVVGKSAYAKDMQHWVHKVTGSKEAQGWHNQLGERPILGLGYLKGMRSYEQQLGDKNSFEWFNSVYIDAGTMYVGAGVGTLIRFGKNVPRNFDVPSALYSNAPNKALNAQERFKDFGYSVEIGTSLNGIGYYYLYEEGEKRGYQFYTPRTTLTSKVGVSLYYDNFNAALEFFPVVTREDTTQSASWGRFSFGWYY